MPWLKAAICLVLSASMAIWLAIFRRQFAGKELIELEPREPVPWGAIELLLAVTIYILAGRTILPIVHSFAARDQPTAASSDQAPALPNGDTQIAGQILFELFTLAACWGCLRWGTRADSADLGVRLDRFGQDARAGLLGLLAAGPPTLVLQALLVKWFPSKHPIIDMLGEKPGVPLLAMTFVLAVVVAPILEEFFFRVLLQGWLERISQRGESWEEVPRPARWPMLVSSAVFASVHAGHGPDPIPLFLLALALGYLYRQTHRIWASFVLHACFNATSMVFLIVSLLAG